MQKLRATLSIEAKKIDSAIEKDLQHLAKKNEPLLLDILRYGLLGGGKRVRPFLVITASALCGEFSEERYNLALAFEYLHCATLFHDDIIDNSLIRRGKSSIQAQFGTTSAILAGDFLLAHAMEIVAIKTGHRGLHIFNRATRGMVNGELWQLRNTDNFNLHIKNYREAVMRKTGLLISSSCEIGGLFAKSSKKERTALRYYGENLGYAFQVIDDILDYYGDSEKTGKAIGNDLSEGKMTLPLLLTIKYSKKEASKRVLEIVKNRELRKTEDAFAEIIAIMEKSNTIANSYHHAEQAVKEGIAVLDIFQKKEVQYYKNLLVELSTFVLNRNK